MDVRVAVIGTVIEALTCVMSSNGEASILFARKNAAPLVGEIERPHVEHEHRIVPSHTSAEDLPQCLSEILRFSFHHFVREQDRPTDTKRPRYARRIFHSHRRGSARHLFRGTNQYWQHRHRVVELYFAVRSTTRGPVFDELSCKIDC